MTTECRKLAGPATMEPAKPPAPGRHPAGPAVARRALRSATPPTATRRQSQPDRRRDPAGNASCGRDRELPPPPLVQHRSPPSQSRSALRRWLAAVSYGPWSGTGATTSRSPPASRWAARSMIHFAFNTVARVARNRLTARTRVARQSISYSTTPKAQISARLSTGLPARLLRRHVGRRAHDHARLRGSERQAWANCRTDRDGCAPVVGCRSSPARSRAPSPCRRA